jgi:ATP-dependent helicase YprA (DUF1998 family)
MTKIKLSKFTNDDGGLASIKDAEFIRTMRWEVGTVYDFTGVVSVSQACLSVLFREIPLTSLVDLIEGATDAVADTIAAWTEAQTTPAALTPAPVPLGHKPPSIIPPQFEQPPELPGERYTPSRLSRRLHRQLISYIESAYPLSEPGLIEARRGLLEGSEGGHLISQEPFVETTPRYPPAGCSYKQLGLDEKLGAFLDKLTRTPSDAEPKKSILFPEMYAHQAKAFQAFLGQGKDLIVATGTGSGKTECFLIPIVGSLYTEAQRRPASFRERGVRVLILYPMNALVNDQLARLRQLLGNSQLAASFRELHKGARHPTFGMYTSRTPYPGPRKTDRDKDDVAPLLDALLGLPPHIEKELALRGRLPAKDLKAFLGADKVETGTYKTGKKKGENYTKHHWEKRLQTGPEDRELLTRHEMVFDPDMAQGHAPDVLVTNYSMLEYMLMRPFERPIFDETRRWLQQDDSEFLLVLDESHMYRGARGAEVAFLIRRLMARLDLLGQSHKLRVILTSASMGGAESAEVAQRFAADLSGKAPASFSVILAKPGILHAPARGDAALADELAKIDLEQLHRPQPGVSMGHHLAGLLTHLGQPAPSDEEGVVLQHLHALLEKHPVIAQALATTAGKAVPLPALALSLFGEHPKAHKATEVLLALGTMARPTPSEPGLLPTRIHMMFRGFEGMYACLDPSCAHGEGPPPSKPNTSGLGKIYHQPRLRCDVCSARVFEVMSCRECGTAYFRAYVPKGGLQETSFLWGEVEGELDAIQVLPHEPRVAAWTEELLVQTVTGQIVSPEHQGKPGIRSVWVARDPKEGQRKPEFERCPICQPETSRRSSRITDLRTRGEQAFAALVDAQFAEQPPMVHNRPDLPNQGRKVLVFSDGRQKAARLAPALETSHQADVFRQVLVLAVRELAEIGEQPQLGLLYPAILHVCLTRGIDLYPTTTTEEGLQVPDTKFHGHLEMARNLGRLSKIIEMAKQGLLQPHLSYAQNLYEAMTDRFLSLRAMGLAVVDLHPAFSYLLKKFPQVGLGPTEVEELLRAWFDVQLERGCFLPPGASIDKIAHVFNRPEGINLDNPRSLIPERFERYLDVVLGEVGRKAVQECLSDVVRGLGYSIDNEYFFRVDGLVLRLAIGEAWGTCASCNKAYLHPLKGRCRDCLSPVSVDGAAVYLESKFGYYRAQVQRALSNKELEPFGLVAAEHSAQLAGLADGDVFTKTEQHELRFQDIRVEGLPPIDVLSCTTTMEVGIDIGALTAVALRNVPPHVANYQQRAGRAGRRGLAVASVMTYAHGGSHDAHYFREPANIIAGAVRLPVVYTENLRVLHRHVNAYLVQRFFHENVALSGKNFQLFASLGKVGDFLSEEHSCSLQRLKAWLAKNAAKLQGELRAWVPTHSHGFDRPIDTSKLVATAIPQVLAEVEGSLPLSAYAQRDNLPPPEKEVLDQTLDRELLTLLIERAVFPRYAFPLDTVAFWVQSVGKKKGGPPGPTFEYQPQRDLQIALTEYAPGRTLTLDKWRFTSAALFSPYQARVGALLEKARSYTACKLCGYVSLESSARTQTTCPVCGSDKMFKRDFIRPEGFAPDVNQPREVDRGGSVPLSMRSTPARIELQQIDEWDEERFDGRLLLNQKPRDLVTVNKGVGDRGFRVCLSCGLAEPEVGKGFMQSRLFSKGVPQPHMSPVARNRSCHAPVSEPLYLGHSFLTDVLLLRLKLKPPLSLFLGDTPQRSGQAARAALTSLAEAIALAASRTLQIDEGELAANWSPALGLGDAGADVYLYDLLPGGAGYTKQVQQHLPLVLEAAERLVLRCSCTSSCYDCLRHYGNQILHTSLDRRLAAALLGWILRGEEPTLDGAEVRRAIEPLAAVLKLRGMEVELDASIGAAMTPLATTIAGVPTVIDVLHPLLDPVSSQSHVAEEALLNMTPCVRLDLYTLEHALPSAVDRLFHHAGGVV